MHDDDCKLIGHQPMEGVNGLSQGPGQCYNSQQYFHLNKFYTRDERFSKCPGLHKTPPNLLKLYQSVFSAPKPYCQLLELSDKLFFLLLSQKSTSGKRERSKLCYVNKQPRTPTIIQTINSYPNNMPIVAIHHPSTQTLHYFTTPIQQNYNLIFLNKPVTSTRLKQQPAVNIALQKLTEVTIKIPMLSGPCQDNSINSKIQ
ncbi:hypothetical protein CEXT_640381 [Caerostris extrusa]|uniref:Uncharacterized protein n=1 Tax=Caerostris extrusa TaxID=172846 RepID=A0AAV4VMV4_CAEEX|nr:hypothetical protein CEXT_640381 [Caerostris extrusa]